MKDQWQVNPGMAKAYRDRVGALIRGLGDAKDMETAKEAIRALIEKIVLKPDDDGGPGLSINLHGALVSLLRLACGLPITGEDTAGAKMQKAPRVAGRSSAALADMEALGIDSKTVLVAGAGFEPAAFRL